MNLKKKVLDNLPSIIIMIIFIIDFIFMFTIHMQWNRAIEKYIPLKNQIVSLRYNVTEAHLWLEEAIGGDEYIDVNRDIIPLFAHRNFHNLNNIKNKLTQDGSDKIILESFLKVDEEVDIIYSLAKKRWQNNELNGIGSDSDQVFDEHFNNFLDLTEKTIEELDKAFTLELQERDGYFKFILAVFLAINLFVYILLYSIKKSKNSTEEMLRTLNDELENRVQERTQKLEDSFRELEKTQEYLIQTEKMASLGSLVAGISHEINTPIGLGITSMTHFISQTQKLKERYEKEEMEQEDFENYIQNTDQLAQVTYENLKRAAELVKSFKQISIDQTSERQREFNLQEYTDETLISLQSKIKRTNVKVEVHSPKTLNIYSYPGAFSQIITNLVMNSLIHAYSAKESGLITLNFELEKSNLLFTYTDDGKGISQEHIGQIFDPFFTTNRAHGGSGLGLNIIYNIVTVQLKGTLECKSEKGQGTAFIMTIPINQGNKNNEI